MTIFKSCTLQQNNLILRPLEDKDCPILLKLAQDNLSQLIYMNGPQKLIWYQQALTDFQQGTAIPFTIVINNKIVGTTRFADINPILPATEIGWTWLDHSLHGTGVNQQIKLLMLQHAFENWHCVRVQIKTAASNLRSQKAIEKLGASKEGHLRNHRRLANGELDDTILYSITHQDWFKPTN